ncbi:MAG TPA: sulfide/dihydroorotate dehydrogenase-like FAD/NAD-binding protein [Phycisphaerae bacterium]|nr:sulfide/dihydroorotate dehydrogenase-like FAD/NAD-binding protein [Phycisphaerae bacterium]HOQ87655.1 sulfide/dihydroorotate dehydrogenase-like FAD/NAD-binding protein [Phycisphaerae bacterium]HPU24556.1 sulfide/dihydroorotate dehydrogenase-like FAD/NAD-binding protein [Phycisphaerae bacterium]HPZ97284.1 sulfide/dihydroorotate dehydrogenase-like FAD/NAD-binding protein [Phycisphaerae bacterium]HQE27321.1 sulfide/dihydroorotate dehydrogenase-like FAD/NAD-binding protein [Phycisphaerae bacteri
MFLIEQARWLAPNVRWMVVRAPRIAARHQAGHFVILRVADRGERIPLTIADSDAAAGTITLVVQVVGATTHRLCSLEAGEHILDVAGPLGRPTEIEKFGHVVLVGGGVGTAVIHPQARAFRAAGNRVTAVIGGRSRPYVILETELARFCQAVHPCTDDGSYGFKGFVTQKLAELIADSSNPVNAVITAGPVPMMKAVADVTRPFGIHTVASLNPIMVDGTGMCGGCRVMVGGKMLFACVDGPEFDAHQVDFAELTGRLTAYREQERYLYERVRSANESGNGHAGGNGEGTGHECRLDAAVKGLTSAT